MSRLQAAGYRLQVAKEFRGLVLSYGGKLSVARGVAHDGEEKEHLENVNQDKHAEEDIEAGERQVGEDAEEGIGQERNPEHAGGQKEAGLELAVFGVEEGKGYLISVHQL